MLGYFNFNIGEPMHYDTMREWLVDQHIDDWDNKIQDSLWYVADNTGLVMMRDMDFESANVYASKMHGCMAYRQLD